MHIEKKHIKQVMNQITFILSLTVLSLFASAYTGMEDASQKVYNLNPTQNCIIEYLKDKKGYVIRGNDDEVFSWINNKYFVSKGECLSTNITNDSTVFKLSNYQFCDHEGQLFINNKQVGTAQKKDIIILHSDKRIDVYNKSRVTLIEKNKAK